METSEQTDQIAAALSRAQSSTLGAVKDAANPFFRSKYADLSSVWDACRKALTNEGLSVAQFPQTDYQGTPEPYEWTSKNGETRYGVRVICVVSMVTRLMHASGQWLQGTVSTMLPSADPQAVGSAITYLRRYGLAAAVGVAPEDDDAEAATGRQMAPVNTQARQFVTTPEQATAAVTESFTRAQKSGQAHTAKPAGVAVKASDIPFREVI